MMAHYYRVPVMVLCQTFKFTESVLLDSFCDNEIGERKGCSSPGVVMIIVIFVLIMIIISSSSSNSFLRRR